MTDFVFTPASKEQAKARIALAGPSGSGKTFTGLTLAMALGDRVAVIDTERGSASKYAWNGPDPVPAGLFKFDRLNMHRYDPRDLVKALAAASAQGFPVVVVDSLSRFWSGQGGMLEQVDNAAKRSYGNNSFGGWKEARPMENAMIEALLGYPGHVIVTMRTKTAYEIVEDERGRKVPMKLGLKPEQREGIEYEFDIVGDMDLENTLTVSKSRCSALAGEVIRRPDASLGEAVLAWLTDGKPAMTAMDYYATAMDPATGYEDFRRLYVQVKDGGLLGAVFSVGGATVTLGDLIKHRGEEAKHALAQPAQQQESPEEPAQQAASTSAAGPEHESAKPAQPAPVTPVPALDPMDPWAVAIEGLGAPEEVENLRADFEEQCRSGALKPGARAVAIRAALDARKAELGRQAVTA